MSLSVSCFAMTTARPRPIHAGPCALPCQTAVEVRPRRSDTLASVTAGASVPSASDGASVALVTGGAIRVGRGIVEALVDAGHRVWIHHRTSHDAAHALQRELDERAAARGLASPVLGLVAADLADA